MPVTDICDRSCKDCYYRTARNTTLPSTNYM